PRSSARGVEPVSRANAASAASQVCRSPAEQRLTASVLFLLAGLAALGALATNIILPAFPAMGEDLDVSVRELSATLTSFFLAFALGQLFVGPLSDRFGRQRLVLIGLAIFIIGSLV